LGAYATADLEDEAIGRVGRVGVEKFDERASLIAQALALVRQVAMHISVIQDEPALSVALSAKSRPVRRVR
jgi:hypothetical protein